MTLKSAFDPLSASNGSVEEVITFDQTAQLQTVCGPHDSHLTRLEEDLEIFISVRGTHLTLRGAKPGVARAKKALKALYRDAAQGDEISIAEVEAQIRLADTPLGQANAARIGAVKPRSPGQVALTKALDSHDLTFAIGPAGTGKTYLAVAAAVAAWQAGKVKRLILCRPAVEAGERIGFLPGDMTEKLDPYMRPLYDALGELLGGKKLAKAMEDGSIEIAPLAFMRGRTLKSAYVILDEGQNATPAQMKMFLTRLGEGSKMAVTGDPTQVDLPKNETSGLVQAVQVLSEVKGISTVRLKAEDVVRHALVGRIVAAYDKV
ncbi:MAG: PhoH family protein [Alphaproteobacteria bacterium]